jgi:uncharacterized metal-binding protein YceD (DUF177 family)
MGKVMKEYVIPVYGLKTGVHHYEFDVDRSFFESFDSDALENPEIKVQLKLEKTSAMLLLEFMAEGKGTVSCDRCGAPMEYVVRCEDKAIVKYGNEDPEGADEIIVLAPQEHELDLAHRIYEMLILSMPPKTVHEKMEDCDQEAIKRLTNHKGDKEGKIDPRWEALRKLK